MPGEGGGVPQGKRGKCSQQDAGVSPHLTHRASLSALLPRVPGRPRLLVCWFLLHQACTRREPSEPSPRQGHPLPRAALPRCAGTERRRGGGPRPRPLSWESLHAGSPGPEQASGDPTPTVSPGPTRTHSSAAPQHGPAHTARDRTGSRPTRRPLPRDALPAGQNGGSQGHWRSRSLGRSLAEVPEVRVSRRFGATLGIPLSHPGPSCPPARPSSVQAERDASEGWTPGQGRGADMQKCPPLRKAGPQPRRG